jgi:type IV secretion system protein VirB10
MRVLTTLAILVLIIGAAAAESDRDFSGVWRLNVSSSEIRGLPAPPDPVLKVEEKGRILTVSGGSQESGPFRSLTYPLDSTETKNNVGGAIMSTRTKWEGSALLVNTLVSGSQNYTVMERWTRSGDGATLRVKRTIVRISGESESLLVYENSARAAASSRSPADRSSTSTVVATNVTKQPVEPEEYTIDEGTRIPLKLVSSVNTKRASPGEQVQLETSFPVVSKGRVIIPRGSFVMGTITEAQRAGRVKGKASLYLRFDSLMLPNGVTRDLRSRVGAFDGNLDREEGKITGEGNKGGDARTVGQTTAAGASIGSIAGRSAKGAGIGAAAGAAAGLARVFGSRGSDLVLPAGTAMEMILDRELRFKAAELRFP